MKKIIRKLVLIFLLVVLVFVCYEKFIQKKPVVKLKKYGILIVLTESMEPEIPEKSFIVIHEEEAYGLNDIVTYLDYDGTLITHRIIQMQDHKFRAKGDNNDIYDGVIDTSRIQGKVVYHSKVLGIFILRYLRWLIFIFLMINLVRYGTNKIREESNEEEKEEV